MSKEILKHLTRNDPALGQFIKICKPVSVAPNNKVTLFESLVKSVIGQQLSGKAASSIFRKLKTNLGDKKAVTVKGVIETPAEDIKNSGVSNSKAKTILLIAEKIQDGTIPTIRKMNRMSDEEIINILTTIKGIGRWTAEMMLISKLGRKDVMPSTDLGIRKGYSIIFRKKTLAAPKHISKRSVRWIPYRSIAAKYCWEAVNTGFEYKSME